MSENQTIKPKEPKLLGYQCRHAYYLPPPDRDADDYHLVKLTAYFDDGTTKPVIKYIPNFKRPFWVEGPNTRTYLTKRESAPIDRLVQHKVRQCDLEREACRALKLGYLITSGNTRRVFESPFLYGSDVSSTSIIKSIYNAKYPDLNTAKNTVAVLDIETDMIMGTEEIIMGSVTMQSIAYHVVSKRCLKSITPTMYIDGVHRLFEQHCGQLIEERGIKLEVEVVEDDLAVMAKLLAKAHEIKPDFLNIFNADFEMSKFVQTAKKYNVHLKDYFSDPSVPTEYRHFKYIPGKPTKITASGKSNPVPTEELWNIVECAASFYVICSRCTYRRLRIAKPKTGSLSLDAILNREGIGGKIKMDVAAQYETDGAVWHRVMQDKHIMEYGVYNLGDCIRPEQLDEKTLDICLRVSLAAGVTDYWNFKSQPKALVDDMHFHELACGRVMGCTGRNMVSEDDDEIVSADGWILNLQTSYMIASGVPLGRELGDTPTRTYTHGNDIDVEGAYPSGQVSSNLSRKTTVAELISVEGLNAEEWRAIGLELPHGDIAAGFITRTAFNFPSLAEMVRAYDAQTVEC